ncbi:hypothetical protein SKAU_G00295510 [Synaphobranchus kaupii]|uniref:Uncharacterized protein n=1 Tax=Synaphobranchus kaupii TaxID=118154 RepID=A0A9Q1IMQ7_SYNKA|nr:hypothetical protein SKAU_G00295510 [Synaphobranchus kaupii]
MTFCSPIKSGESGSDLVWKPLDGTERPDPHRSRPQPAPLTAFLRRRLKRQSWAGSGPREARFAGQSSLSCPL